MLAAAGKLNWQRRQEFDTFVRHASTCGDATATALRRMGNASAVIGIMPETVLTSGDQKAILENEQ